MIFPLVFISSFSLAFEIICYLSEGCLNYYFLIALSGSFGIFLIGFLTAFLLKFTTISFTMGIIEIIVFSVISLFLRVRRKTCFKHNLNDLKLYFFVIPFAFLMVRSHFFSMGSDVSLSKDSFFFEHYSIMNSISRGNNKKMPFFINYECNMVLNQMNEFDIINALMIKCGSSPNFSITFIILICLISTFSSLHYFSNMFSDNEELTSVISILLFTFITKTHPEELLLSTQNIIALPFVIFGYSILLNGVFGMFKSQKKFILAALCTAATFFSSPNLFYASLIIDLSIALITFPYKYLYYWQSVLQKWYVWLVVTVVAIIPQMYWVDCVNDRSLVIKIPHRDYLALLFKHCPITFLMFLIFTWKPLISSAQRITNCSFVVAYLVTAFIGTPITDYISVLLGSFLPFMAVSVANFLAYLISNKKKLISYIGLLLFAIIVIPNMCRSAIKTRNQKVEYFNETTNLLGSWALQYTNPNSIIFSENRNFDPFLAIAGRVSPEGPTSWIKRTTSDIPHSMRILSFLMRSAGFDNVLQTYRIQYLAKERNSTSLAFMNLEKATNFQKVVEVGNTTLYKYIKPLK